MAEDRATDSRYHDVADARMDEKKDLLQSVKDSIQYSWQIITGLDKCTKRI